MKPFHKHDCSDCQYLGSEEVYNKDGSGPYDFYYCPANKCTGEFRTLIARYGEGNNYTSEEISWYLERRDALLKSLPNWGLHKAYEFWKEQNVVQLYFVFALKEILLLKTTLIKWLLIKSLIY